MANDLHQLTTLPTGDDTLFSIGPQTFVYQNDTVHLVPFAGILTQSPESFTFQGFVLSSPSAACRGRRRPLCAVRRVIWR